MYSDSWSLFFRADTESLPCLIAMVSEHHKELADIPEHVKVRHPHTFLLNFFLMPLFLKYYFLYFRNIHTQMFWSAA